MNSDSKLKLAQIKLNIDICFDGEVDYSKRVKASKEIESSLEKAYNIGYQDCLNGFVNYNIEKNKNP